MNEKLKVLVVDDDELAQDFLRLFLLKKFEVFTVGSVNAFYNIIPKIDFDLILMDISLRDSKDGIELTRELKNHIRYKNIPVIMLTAFNSTKTKTQAIEAGADKFLTKPVVGRELMQVIESIQLKN